jgi:ABC-type transporter Mla subunit MlaD
MKSKSIFKRIKSSLRLIKEIKKKDQTQLTEDAGKQFDEHLKKHEDTVILNDEIVTLKASLKARKKQMGKALKELSESQKTTKKVLKKARKTKIPAAVKKSVSQPPARKTAANNIKKKPAAKATPVKKAAE